MDMKLEILATFVVFLTFLHKSNSLSCYVCVGTTANGLKDDCENLSSMTTDEKQRFAQQCGTNETMCRKIFHEIGDDTRTAYQCAKNGDDGCIRRTGTKNLILRYCHCTGELCNTAHRTGSGSLAVIGLTATIAVISSTLFC